MKIQCDVCEKDEAAVYCIADEAALCSACDHRVHHANKLAGKHQRFTLQNPPPKQAPLCDICHEKRAFLFCQQDRAILCRDCDVPIHKANELTQKHNRFLLTGVKLSPTSTLYSNESSPSSSENIPNLKSKKESNSKPLAAVCTPPTETSTTRQSTTALVQGVPGDISGGDFSSGLISQSSISEYLIETLPGWHVEDFLDCSFPSPHGLFQSGGNDLEPFWDDDLEKNIRFGVPQANRSHSHHHDYDRDSTQNQSVELVWGFGGNKEQSKDYFANNMMMINKSSNRKWIEERDSSFLVPQMSHTSNVSKRSRTSW